MHAKDDGNSDQNWVTGSEKKICYIDENSNLGIQFWHASPQANTHKPIPLTDTLGAVSCVTTHRALTPPLPYLSHPDDQLMNTKVTVTSDSSSDAHPCSNARAGTRIA